jgi:hypothetical protein
MSVVFGEFKALLGFFIKSLQKIPRIVSKIKFVFLVFFELKAPLAFLRGARGAKIFLTIKERQSSIDSYDPTRSREETMLISRSSYWIGP